MPTQEPTSPLAAEILALRTDDPGPSAEEILSFTPEGPSAEEILSFAPEDLSPHEQLQMLGPLKDQPSLAQKGVTPTLVPPGASVADAYGAQADVKPISEDVGKGLISAVQYIAGGEIVRGSPARVGSAGREFEEWVNELIGAQVFDMSTPPTAGIGAERAQRLRDIARAGGTAVTDEELPGLGSNLWMENLLIQTPLNALAGATAIYGAIPLMAMTAGVVSWREMAWAAGHVAARVKYGAWGEDSYVKGEESLNAIKRSLISGNLSPASHASRTFRSAKQGATALLESMALPVAVAIHTPGDMETKMEAGLEALWVYPVESLAGPWMAAKGGMAIRGTKVQARPRLGKVSPVRGAPGAAIAAYRSSYQSNTLANSAQKVFAGVRAAGEAGVEHIRLDKVAGKDVFLKTPAGEPVYHKIPPRFTRRIGSFLKKEPVPERALVLQPWAHRLFYSTPTWLKPIVWDVHTGAGQLLVALNDELKPHRSFFATSEQRGAVANPGSMAYLVETIKTAAAKDHGRPISDLDAERIAYFGIQGSLVYDKRSGLPIVDMKAALADGVENLAVWAREAESVIPSTEDAAALARLRKFMEDVGVSPADIEANIAYASRVVVDAVANNIPDAEPTIPPPPTGHAQPDQQGLAGLAVERRRPLSAGEAEVSIDVNLSSRTGSIGGLELLNTLASKGDLSAQHLVSDIAFDSVKHLLSGIESVEIKANRTVGLYGGDFESSLGLVVSFAEADEPAVRAGLMRFGKNFNQEEIHVRGVLPKGSRFGGVHADGSYNTRSVHISLSKKLSRAQIEKAIKKSGIYGATFSDDFIEVYFVGDPENAKDRTTWNRQKSKLIHGLRGGVRKVSTGTRRLWIYSDKGSGPLSYRANAGDVHPATEGAARTSRRIAARIAQHRSTAPASKARPTKADKDKQAAIAAAYGRLPDADTADPQSARAYSELASELTEQYRLLPVKVTLSKKRYASSKAFDDDVMNHNRVRIAPTNPKSFADPSHPMLRPTEFVDTAGKPLLMGDVLNAVHSYYTQSAPKTKKSLLARERGWMAHMEMTRSPWARWALTTETRGHGSHVATTRAASRGKRRSGLLPQEYAMIGDSVIDAELPAISRVPRPGREFLGAVVGDKLDPNSLGTAATLYQAITTNARKIAKSGPKDKKGVTTGHRTVLAMFKKNADSVRGNAAWVDYMLTRSDDGAVYRWTPAESGSEQAALFGDIQSRMKGKKGFELPVSERGALTSIQPEDTFLASVDKIKSKFSKKEAKKRKELFVELMKTDPSIRISADPDAPLLVKTLAREMSDPNSALYSYYQIIRRQQESLPGLLGVDPEVIFKRLNTYTTRLWNDATESYRQIQIDREQMSYGVPMHRTPQRHARKQSEVDSQVRLYNMHVDDPTGFISEYALKNSIDVTDAIIANLHFFSELHDSLKSNGLLFSKPKPGYTRVASFRDVESKKAASADPYNFMFGKMAGKYVPHEVATNLRLARDSFSQTQQLLTTWKIIHTMYNFPGYQIRNEIGDLLNVASRSGLSPIDAVWIKLKRQAAKETTAWLKDDTISPDIKRLLSDGFIEPRGLGASAITGDLNARAQLGGLIGDEIMPAAIDGMDFRLPEVLAKVRFISELYETGTAAIPNAVKKRLKKGVWDRYVRLRRAWQKESAEERGLKYIWTGGRGAVRQANLELADTAIARWTIKEESSRRIFAYKIAKRALKLSDSAAVQWAKDTVHDYSARPRWLRKVQDVNGYRLGPVTSLYVPPFATYGVKQSAFVMRNALNNPDALAAWMVLQGMNAYDEQIREEADRVIPGEQIKTSMNPGGSMGAEIAFYGRHSLAAMNTFGASHLVLNGGTDLANAAQDLGWSGPMVKAMHGWLKSGNMLHLTRTLNLRDIGNTANFMMDFQGSRQLDRKIARLSPFADWSMQIWSGLQDKSFESLATGEMVPPGEPTIAPYVYRQIQQLVHMFTPVRSWSSSGPMSMIFGENRNSIEAASKGHLYTVRKKQYPVDPVSAVSKTLFPGLGITAVSQAHMWEQVRSASRARMYGYKGQAARFGAKYSPLNEKDKQILDRTGLMLHFRITHEIVRLSYLMGTIDRSAYRREAKKLSKQWLTLEKKLKKGDNVMASDVGSSITNGAITSLLGVVKDVFGGEDVEADVEKGRKLTEEGLW